MINFIKQKFKSITGLLILTVFFTSLVPAILNYIFDFYLIFQEAKTTANLEIEIHQKDFETFLNKYLISSKHIVSSYVQLLDPKDKDSLEKNLRKIQEIYWDNWFHHFFIIDKNGRIILSPEYKGVSHLNEKIEIDIQKIKEPYITSFNFFKEGNHFHPLLIIPFENHELWLGVELNISIFNEFLQKGILHSYIIDSSGKVYGMINQQFSLIENFSDHQILSFKDQKNCEFVQNHIKENVYACILKQNHFSIITEIPTKEIFSLFKLQLIRTSIVFILLGVIIIYILYKTSKRIIRPIQEITIGIEEMEQNKGLNLHLEAKTGIQETDSLVQKFNLLLERINKLIGEIRNTSENIDKLFILVKNLSQTIEKSSVDLSSILEENSASLQEINSNMDDIETLGNKNQESAKEIQEIIQTNLQRLNELGKNLENLAEISKNTANFTKESKNQSESLKNMIYAMQESSERITEILSIIKEISDRTNLLSLNASIEAARAGESGKGFAVVAQSISNLADTTEKSVQDIEELIEHTTTQMNQAIQFIDKSNEMMNKSFEMVNSLDIEIQNSKNIVKSQLERSNKILENATKMYSIARDTFNSIKFIKDIIREINHSIDEASKVSIQFTETSKKLNDSISNLDESARKLKEQMKKFTK